MKIHVYVISKGTLKGLSILLVLQYSAFNFNGVYKL